MKSLIAFFLVMASAQASMAAIKCTGQKVGENTDVYVEVDGNPLEIFVKEVSAKNAGLSLSVSILESESIMAEAKTNSWDPSYHAEFQIKPAGLPKGLNAKLVLRKMSANDPVPMAKDVYLLKCSGKLPAVYR